MLQRLVFSRGLLQPQGQGDEHGLVDPAAASAAGHKTPSFAMQEGCTEAAAPVGAAGVVASSAQPTCSAGIFSASTAFRSVVLDVVELAKHRTAPAGKFNRRNDIMKQHLVRTQPCWQMLAPGQQSNAVTAIPAPLHPSHISLWIA